MSPAATCHKCKAPETSTLIYPTRAPTCGPCLERKVAFAFQAKLKRAARPPLAATTCILDEANEPELLHYFTDNKLPSSLRPVRPATSEKDIQDTLPAIAAVDSEQRRRILTQVRNGVLARLAQGGVWLHAANSQRAAGRVFEKILAGSTDSFDNYAEVMKIALLDQLEDTEVAALRHHLFAAPGEAFVYESSGLDEHWTRGVERSSEKILAEFMHRIPAEMPSAVSNVLATARKLPPTHPLKVCEMCRAEFQELDDDWLPTDTNLVTGLSLCPLCSIAFRNIDLDLVLFAMKTLCSE